LALRADKRMKGKLIVIDGSDGTGKATQTSILVKRIQEMGHKVGTLDFPRYKNPSAWFVEQYLQGNFGDYKSIGPKKASLFYALDRYAASSFIEDDLKKGMHLILDRYVSANIGHQASKMDNANDRIEFANWVEDLEYGILELPKPDLQIILHLDPELGQSAMRKQGRLLDVHEADIEHLKKSNDTYVEMAASRPDWHIIECANDSGGRLSIDEVATEIWQVVKPLISNNS
jgi:dTMP kinase